MNYINFRHISSLRCRLHKRYPERHIRIIQQHNKNSLKLKRHTYNFYITNQSDGAHTTLINAYRVHDLQVCEVLLIGRKLARLVTEQLISNIV
jgi:hypothetical protein